MTVKPTQTMRDSEARSLAEIGEFYIQTAILKLLEKREHGLLLGQIAAELALPEQGYNAVITGQLRRLKDQGRVHQPNGVRTEWALTAGERTRRQGW